MNACEICGLPVLEIEGQFENLEPYYAEEGHPAAVLVGECHAGCLLQSEHGRVWHDWRVRGYTTNRGYRLAGEVDGWSVLVHGRLPELLAFHVDGTSVGGTRPPSRSARKNVAGGVLVAAVEHDFNLKYSDAALLDEIKAQLKSHGTYPIAALLEALGIADRVRWPQALPGAAFVFDKRMQRNWTRTGVAMRARYSVFIPEPIVPFWEQL